MENNNINNTENSYIKLSVLFIIFIIILSFFLKDIIIPKNNNDNSFAILLNVGETYSLNNNDLNLNWVSSDEKIAVVDNNGKVTAKSDGIVTITAYKNEQILYQYTIKIVNEDVSVLNIVNDEITMKVNSSYKLKLDIEPENYDLTKLKWNYP